MSKIILGVRSVAIWSSGRRLYVLVPCFFFLLWLISFSPWWFSEATIKTDHGIGTLDLQFASSAEHARATLDQLGSSGRSAYDSFQIIDVLFPLSYAFGLSGLIWSLWRGLQHRWVVYLAALPLVGAAFDYVENVLVRVALSTYPTVPRGVLAASVTVTTLKLVLSYLSQALVVIGLVAALLRFVRARQHDRERAASSP